MDQSFNARFQLDERTELDHPRHSPADPLAIPILFGCGIPGGRLQLFQSDRDSSLSRVRDDFQNASFQLLPHGENILRLADAAPRNVAYVKQGVDAADVHEGAVVGEAADGSVYRISFFDLGELPILDRLFLFPPHRPPIHTHISLRDLQLTVSP